MESRRMIMAPGYSQPDQWQVQIQAQVQIKARVMVKSDRLGDDRHVANRGGRERQGTDAQARAMDAFRRWRRPRYCLCSALSAG